MIFEKITHLSLTHCGRVTQYGNGSMLCKNFIFFTMKEFPQIPTFFQFFGLKRVECLTFNI